MYTKEICKKLGALAVFALAPFAASAVTIPLAAGGNINAAVESANAGDIITLANGTYTPSATGGFPGGATVFAANKGVTIRGNLANPAAVVLNAGANGTYGFQVLSYVDAFHLSPRPYPNNFTLEGVTINVPSGYGILVDDYTAVSSGLATQRFTNVTLRNVVVTAGAGNGIDAGAVSKLGPQRLTLDNVTVTANAVVGAITLVNTIDSLVMNSRVTGAPLGGTTGLMVDGGSNNTLVGNTIGNVPALNGTTIGGTGVTISNTQANRFESNVVQGFTTDGVAVLNQSLGVTTVPAYDNYVGKNTVISNGYAAMKAGVPNRDKGTPIWMTCGANNTWVYGNDASGGSENGIAVWSSNSNMILGNASHANEDGAYYVDGSAAVQDPAECTAASAAFHQKTTSTFLRSNSGYFNTLDEITIRESDATEIVSNFISPHNGAGGASQPCVTINCQSAFNIETIAAGSTSSNNRILFNTSLDNLRGIWVNQGGIINQEFALNRVINSVSNRMQQPSTLQTLDRGANIGGNFWSQHVVSGNPSATPFTKISYTQGDNQDGPVSDRFPFQSETFGISTMTISEPTAGMTYAAGTARTVRWNAPGCTFVDIVQDAGTVVQSNVPGTGYAVVTLPATAGAHTMTVRCKNSSATLTGQSATTGSYTVVANQAQLLSPGRDDVWNPGAGTVVAWKRASGYVANVSAEYSTDNGATWLALPPAATNNSGNFAYITIPSGAATAYARVRIKDTGTNAVLDSTDGVFGLRGTSPGFKNVPAARSFLMGRIERIEWASPANSRRVSIVKNPGAITVVNDLPDRGFYDWVVPDLGTSTGVSFTITYKDTNGVAISSVASNTVATNFPSLTGPFTLSVTAAGNGHVTSAPAGINCPPTCSAVFPLNQAVTLTASPTAGNAFFGWTGACTGSATCPVTMSGDRSAVASFYTGTLTTRYRLYYGSTFEHLYTTDLNEYNVLPACCGWQPEGAIYQIFRTAGSFGGVTAGPLYRLYNPFSFQHHWTVDFNEYSVLATIGWQQEGTDGLVLLSPASGTIPVYRLFLNQKGGLHLWTTDANERNVLTTSAGWVDEGIAFYALPLVP